MSGGRAVEERGVRDGRVRAEEGGVGYEVGGEVSGEGMETSGCRTRSGGVWNGGRSE